MSSYHHGNLRASLVQTGVELARADGPDGVVLREVARRAGVSHNAAYRHFADREALLAEIAEAGMQRLGDAMKSELDVVDASGPDDPATRSWERLRATGRAYVEFAVAEPGLFEVAFSCDPPEPGREAVDDGEHVHPFDLLISVLDEAVTTGAVAAEHRPGAEVVCWSAVHGFASLHVKGPLEGLPAEERAATLEVMLDHVARGLA